MPDIAASAALPADRYKYDVAFSFLAQDESIATSLNELLRDRVRTFLYSEKQKELAGKDGEQTFNTIFGEQSRFVAVLYRAGWGENRWTRIEQTSIRNRGFEQGYTFVLFIKLDDAAVPKWLPKSQLWVGFQRWGLEGAASVIESRVQELGGEVGEETVTGRAARLSRQLAFSYTRSQFLATQGIKAAQQEFAGLQQQIEREIAAINAAGGAISLALKATPYETIVLGPGRGLSVAWRAHYINTLNDAALYVTVWNGHPPSPNIIHIDAPEQLAEETYSFDLLPPDRPGWVNNSATERTYSTDRLASHVLKLFLQHMENLRY